MPSQVVQSRKLDRKLQRSGKRATVYVGSYMAATRRSLRVVRAKRPDDRKLKADCIAGTFGEYCIMKGDLGLEVGYCGAETRDLLTVA